MLEVKSQRGGLNGRAFKIAVLVFGFFKSAWRELRADFTNKPRIWYRLFMPLAILWILGLTAFTIILV
jgi:hypothetical protein